MLQKDAIYQDTDGELYHGSCLNRGEELGMKVVKDAEGKCGECGESVDPDQEISDVEDTDDEEEDE
jgi:hypothetical protein